MVRKNGPACPMPPEDTMKVKAAPITPIVSVKSVNGMSGDVELKTLTIGDKVFNGSDDKKVYANDIRKSENSESGLKKAFVYEKQGNKTQLEAWLLNAEVGDVFFCTDDKLFYLSIGEGEAKKFPSKAALDNYASKQWVEEQHYLKEADLSRFSLVIETGNKLNLDFEASTGELTIDLLDKNGNVIDSKTVDLPLEKLVESGTYDATRKEIVLILKDGSQIRIPVADLVTDLATKAEVEAVRDDIPTKTSELTNDSGFLTQHQDISGKADKTYVDTEVAKKQDTLTAGENIKIENNVISSTASAKLSAQFTATNAIGNITVGEVFAAGTTFEDIIKRMLTAPPAPTVYDVYFGGLSTLPTSASDISRLTKTTQNVTDMQSGVARNIAADEQYVTIAYKASVGNITSITEDGFEAISDFSNIFTFGDYKFYCTADKVYDPEAEINFVIKWSIN